MLIFPRFASVCRPTIYGHVRRLRFRVRDRDRGIDYSEVQTEWPQGRALRFCYFCFEYRRLLQQIVSRMPLNCKWNWTRRNVSSQFYVRHCDLHFR